MINKLFFYILLTVAIIGFYFFYSQEEKKYLSVNSFSECVSMGYPIMESYPEKCMTPDKRIFINESQVIKVEGVATSTGKENLIVVNNIKNGQLIKSPLLIKGQARGYWYFEASFPVEILDGNGKRLTIIPAQAESDWMTENFVPFSVTLVFETPDTATGTIILHKDNPSGEKSRDNSLSIPIKFK